MVKKDNTDLVEKFNNFLEENAKNNNYELKNFDESTERDFTDYILIEVAHGGYRGGNCWNDDQPEPYFIDTDVKVRELADNIIGKFSYFLDDLGFKDNLQNVAYSTAEAKLDNYLSSREHNEYYGNYTEYHLYDIQISEILEATLDTPTFLMYQEVLANKTLDNQPILLKTELLGDKKETERQLKVFDKNKEREKKEIKTILDRYQKMYDGLDSKNQTERQVLNDKLSAINEKLEIFNSPIKKYKP